MSAVMLSSWLILVLVTGYATLRCLEGSRTSTTRAEAITLAFALGTGFLTLAAMVLRAASRLTLPWLVVAIAFIVTVAFLVVRARERSQRAGGDARWFAAAASAVLAAQLVVMWPLASNVFGADSYTWAETATRLACSPPACAGEGAEVAVLHVDPSGYGYLMATAVVLGVDLTAGETLVGVSLAWTAFAMLAGFALANHLAGPKWGALGAVWYVSSYWALYYLMTSIARQGLGLGFAPLVLLFIAKRGMGVVREPLFYAVVAAGWLIHPFSVFMVLVVVPFVLAHAVATRGLAALGSLEIGLGLGLALPPSMVLGRFVLSALGYISDAPYKYQMAPFDPVELLQTMGPLNVLALAAGVVVWRRRPPTISGALWSASLALVVILLCIGILPRDWYKASNIALPAHRYYLFYPLVSLVWIAGVKDASSRFRTTAVWLVLGALTSLQWAGDAYFARRMLLPRPRLEASLEAARFVDARAGVADTVAIHFGEPAVVLAVSRAVLAPRRIVVLGDASVEDAARSNARFWITDSPIGNAESFEVSGSRVSVIELARREQSDP